MWSVKTVRVCHNMFPAMSAVWRPTHMSKQWMTGRHMSSIRSWWMFDMFLPLLRTLPLCCCYMTSRRSCITKGWTTQPTDFHILLSSALIDTSVLLTWFSVCIVNMTNNVSSILQVSVNLADWLLMYIASCGKRI